MDLQEANSSLQEVLHLATSSNNLVASTTTYAMQKSAAHNLKFLSPLVLQRLSGLLSLCQRSSTLSLRRWPVPQGSLELSTVSRYWSPLVLERLSGPMSPFGLFWSALTLSLTRLLGAPSWFQYVVSLVSNLSLLCFKMGFSNPTNHLWNRRSC